MRITVHRDNIGRRDDGTWVMRSDDGWTVIDPPAWADKPTREASPSLEMADPLKRNMNDVPTVKLRRVTRIEVPDYKADVLLRMGWELDT